LADRILFVDDEQGVLDGYERLLRKEFFVTVARGGVEGLAAIEDHGPFAVVISDMRMPGMSGAEFLAQVRHSVPTTVRMLLTGFTDLSAAIDAVNEGNIFRFLTKPCRKEVLVDAINLGLAQHHSIIAEKTLLKRAMAIEISTSDQLVPDICQWDNFEGPTGLPGPTQARLSMLCGAADTHRASDARAEVRRGSRRRLSEHRSSVPDAGFAFRRSTLPLGAGCRYGGSA
jgi:FixJ family two-component response regulator